MNKIIEHQNDQTILDKLSAQRKLYDKAKKLRGLRFFLGVVLVVCLSVARLVWSGGEWIETALVFASAAALVLEPLLESLINKKRMLAAQIQQRLDNALYRFDWDECVCGKEPSDEAVCDLKDDVVDDKLRNWYDVGIGEVEDENVATLLCQRENISYDAGLRIKYVTLSAWIAAILGTGVLMLSFVEGWDMMRFLVFGVIPAIPIAEWFITIFQDNAADRENLDSLEELVKDEIEKAVVGGRVAKKTLQKIQNLLFLHRKSGYLIPRWFYKCNRDKSEKRAAYSVREFLYQYRPDR